MATNVPPDLEELAPWHAPVLTNLGPVNGEDFRRVLQLRRQWSIDYPDGPPAVNLNVKWQKHEAGKTLYPEDIAQFENGTGRFEKVNGPGNKACNTLFNNYKHNDLNRKLKPGEVEAPGAACSTQNLATLDPLEGRNPRAPLDPSQRIANPLQGGNSRTPFDSNVHVPSDPNAGVLSGPNLRARFDLKLHTTFDPNPRHTHPLEGGHSRAPDLRIDDPLEEGNTSTPFDRNPSCTGNPDKDAAHAELSGRGGGGTANAPAHAIPAPPHGLRAPAVAFLAPALAPPAPVPEPWFMSPVMGPTTRAQWLQEHPPTPAQSRMAQVGASPTRPATQRGYPAPPANSHHSRANAGSIVHAMPGSINRAYYGEITDGVPGSITNPTPGSIAHSIPRPVSNAAPGPVAQATSGSVFDAVHGHINQATQPTPAARPQRVTMYPALMVLSDVMKLEVSLNSNMFVKFNTQHNRLTVHRNKDEMFRVNLKTSRPTKVAHSSDLQMFYVKLQSTGENEEPSAILFKMAIPRDKSEMHANFRSIFTSKVPKEGNRVFPQDEAYFSMKEKQLERLITLGARRDGRVDELLTPQPRFQTPSPRGPPFRFDVNVVERQINKSPHRVVSAKKVTAKPDAAGLELVPVQVRPNDGHLQQHTSASVGIGSAPNESETVRVEKSSGDGAAGIAMVDDGITITNDNDNLPAHSEVAPTAKAPNPMETGGHVVKDNPPANGKKVEKPQWQREERDGCTYKIMCPVRAEVNDIVFWVRDNKLDGSVDEVLDGMDGPFKILEVSTENMACKLDFPEDSKVKDAWVPVDRLMPVRKISNAEIVVVAQDNGAMPIPIRGVAKISDENWCYVRYFPASDPRVRRRSIFRVLGRRVVGPGDTIIVPGSEQAFHANIPKRAQYLVGFTYYPSDDNKWLNGPRVPLALLNRYNAQNPEVPGSGANVIAAWPYGMEDQEDI